MAMTPRELTDYLHAQVPLTAAMQVQVVRSDADEVQLGAPLTANRNLHGTAFGGSLATLGMICGWALLHLAMREEKLVAQLVIQRSECDYERPVDGDFTAASRLPREAWPDFVAVLKRRGRARITVRTEIRAAGGEAPAVVHRGRYVAVSGKDRAVAGLRPVPGRRDALV